MFDLWTSFKLSWNDPTMPIRNERIKKKQKQDTLSLSPDKSFAFHVLDDSDQLILSLRQDGRYQTESLAVRRVLSRNLDISANV